MRYLLLTVMLPLFPKITFSVRIMLVQRKRMKNKYDTWFTTVVDQGMGDLCELCFYVRYLLFLFVGSFILIELLGCLTLYLFHILIDVA